jgi:hypothetical protein
MANAEELGAEMSAGAESSAPFYKCPFGKAVTNAAPRQSDEWRGIDVRPGSSKRS